MCKIIFSCRRSAKGRAGEKKQRHFRSRYRGVGGPAMQAPTSKRQDFHKNYIARSQFHRRGEHCSPALAASATPKYPPQAKASGLHKKATRPGAQNFFQACPGRACFLFFPFQVGALCGALTLWGLRQYRIILSADTVSEVRQMLSQKRRQYFVYWRAFWQRRCRAAADGAVLKP